jgi:DNA polymerase-3 subunit epsilon
MQTLQTFTPSTNNTTSLLLDDLKYAVVDLETTGTHPSNNQIIEIGIVQIDHGEITETFQTFLDPGISVPPFITGLTGITDRDLEGAPLFPDVAPKILRYLDNRIFVAHNVGFDYNFLQKQLRKCDITFEAQKVCTVQLSRKLIPNLAHHTLDDLARHFHLQIPNRHRALDDALATGKSLLQMVEMLKDMGKTVFSALFELTQPAESKKYKLLKPTIDQIPQKPGIYIMRDRDQQIIYIGKSKCLQKRVRSYFYSNIKKPKKLEKLIETVESIEYQLTGSELSALLLESKKIKEHLPVFNRMIRNFKAYPFLKISNEAFPRLYATREIRNDNAIYLGPFKSSSMLEETIAHVQKAFNLRPCKHKINPKKPETLKLCLYYELGECPGVCGGKMSKEEYAQSIDKAITFLAGNNDLIIKKIEKNIDEASENMLYEQAAEMRDQLIGLQRVLAKQQRITKSVKDNNAIIVEEGLERQTKEIFCIKNGIVTSRFTVTYNQMYSEDTTLDFDEYSKYQSKKTNAQKESWQQILESVYEKTEQPKITKENLDDLMIISTWLMQHSEKQSIYHVNSLSDIGWISEELSQKYIVQK